MDLYSVSSHWSMLTHVKPTRWNFVVYVECHAEDIGCINIILKSHLDAHILSFQ